MPSSARFLPLALLAPLAMLACGPVEPDFQNEPWATDGDFLAFDPNNLFTDAEFTDSGSMTAAEIQAFLENTHCGNRSSLADYSSNGKTAAQAIADASSTYHLNPIAFLARLQTESSAVCQSVSSHRLDRAFGCGCPDNGSCAPAFLGFDRQVQCAGQSLRSYLDDIAGKGQTVSGWAPGRTKSSLDHIAVTPTNATTAALYTYTPWVYNGGNQLHWQVWHQIAGHVNDSALVGPDNRPPPRPRPGPCGDDAQNGGCSTDAECNHGATGTGVICANGGPQRGSCIEACHTDTDCPEGSTCDQTASPHWQCTSALTALGTACTDDKTCNGGDPGTGRVCSTQTNKCILGCHDESDCGGGAMCDRSLPTWMCVQRKEIGDECASDAECHGGVGATQRVCGNEGKCIDACHTDWDCAEDNYCSHETARWSCQYVPPESERPDTCRPPSDCPVLTFPSGVSFQTKPDAALTEVYRNHLGPGDTAPKCFVDVDDLYDPSTGQTHDYAHVRVSTHFTLQELVGTEINQGWGRRVLVQPNLVEALESFRASVGVPVSLTSGYRSPRHQEAICESICGNPLGCNGTCSNNSRHMFGDAADLPSAFYSFHYAQVACSAGFMFAYAEMCNHLHLDMNPRYGSCSIAFDNC